MSVVSKKSTCIKLLKKLAIGSKRAAVILSAVSLLIPVIQRDVSASVGNVALRHSRISVHRNDDGSVKLGSRNAVETSNWSGYSLENFSTGQTYSSASASWTVPKVSFQEPPQTCHTIHSRHSSPKSQCFAQTVDMEYSSSWVGIGGTCEDANCTRADNTLIQLGTEQDVAADGTTEYYAWYEMLPRSPVVISSSSPSSSSTSPGSCRGHSCATPNPVLPGDSITASLACQTNCNPGQNQTWLLTMNDTTQKWTFSTTLTYRSTLASVEWIQEAPTSNAGVLPLADFVTTTFDPTDNHGMIPTLPNAANGTVGVDAITMVDPYGETSEPSPVAGLDVFSTCWGNNSNSIASCPVP